MKMNNSENPEYIKQQLLNQLSYDINEKDKSLTINNKYNFKFIKHFDYKYFIKKALTNVDDIVFVGNKFIYKQE